MLTKLKTETKKMKKQVLFCLLLVASQLSFGQDDDNSTSNIQTYTPSKLLNQGQWDIKWFNNLYTEVKFSDSDGNTSSKARENYFTSTIEAFTGISENNRINVGVIVEIRSNTTGGRDAFSVFSFDQRAGITSIAPAIKWQPIESVGNFSVQTALHIPLVENETKNGVFLDQKSWIFQNRLFYDYTFPSGNWQLFTELNTEFSFGNKLVFDKVTNTSTEGSYANNSITFTPGIFMSYFPNSDWTILGFLQHSERYGDATQNFTALGLGGKYQLSSVLNLEVLYSNFVRGADNGLGESFNIGLRVLF